MKTDLVIMGGGLWGSLLAWSLHLKRPDVNFILYEGNEVLGGNHTWSFHESDISKANLELVRPFIVKSWPSYKVKFPEYTKEIKLPYHSMTSDKLHKAMIETLPAHRIQLGKRINKEDALKIGHTVIDTRGSIPGGSCGYQKFVGLEIKTEKPHGLIHPVLMDATVDQVDGFRFIYYLPFSEDTVLIEDTRYSDNSFLDHFRINEQILALIRQNGWSVKKVIREEYGSLPIPFEEQPSSEDSSVIELKNMFHDTTGYSLPDALRCISGMIETDMSHKNLQRVLDEYKQKRKDHRKFFCLLNRLMFQASEEKERYKTLEFFYRSKPSLVSSFYRGEMTALDKIRFFAGKPPVKISKAFKVFKETLL